MTTYVPKAVQEGLEAARLAGLKKVSRLRVQDEEGTYKVLRLWKTGFSVEHSTTPKLRGLVDLYDGANHLYQCLIVADEAEAGEMRYDFKRLTLAADQVPLDFYRLPDAPIGLIPFDQTQGKI